MGVDFHLGHGKRDFWKGEKDHSNTIGPFKRFFKGIFPSEKHLVLSPHKKEKTSKTKIKSWVNPKQNTCHKKNFERESSPEENLNNLPQFK